MPKRKKWEEEEWEQDWEEEGEWAEAEKEAPKMFSRAVPRGDDAHSWSKQELTRYIDAELSKGSRNFVKVPPGWNPRKLEDYLLKSPRYAVTYKKGKSGAYTVGYVEAERRR